MLLKIPFQKASSHSQKALKALNSVDGIFSATEVFYQTVNFILHACLNRPNKENVKVQGIKGGWERGGNKCIFISGFLYKTLHIHEEKRHDKCVFCFVFLEHSNCVVENTTELCLSSTRSTYCNKRTGRREGARREGKSQ